MCFNARGRSIQGGVGTYRYFFGGSYVALMHCLCWRYRRDVDQLRERIYPFLREVLAFYLSLMRRGDDGRYHLWPAHAPELNLADIGDPVQNLCMLKVCLQTALEAAQVLGDAGEHVGHWRDLLDHLPAYPVAAGAGGPRVLDAVGVPPEHYISQAGGLYPVYPCGEVDALSSPEAIALYRRTLEAALAQIAEKVYATEQGYHFKCAWQCFFLAMSALRLGEVTEFRETYLPLFLRCYAKPNGLLSHDACVIADPAASEANLAAIPDRVLTDVDEPMPAFEPWCGHNGGTTPNPEAKRLAVPLIEASGDFLTMVTESLLQSHNGVIRVFPGWPLDRPAAFTDLVAEGDILVSAACRDGRVTRLSLRRGPRCGADSVRLWTPDSGAVETVPLPTVREGTRA
jgi:hypothetical protein